MPGLARLRRLRLPKRFCITQAARICANSAEKCVPLPNRRRADISNTVKKRCTIECDCKYKLNDQSWHVYVMAKLLPLMNHWPSLLQAPLLGG